jgi:hypothetical protein
MKYIYRVNGEERFPTIEERQKLTRQFMEGLGFRPVKTDKKNTVKTVKNK